MTKLEAFDLSFNWVTQSGIEEIADALRTNTKLERLYLGGDSTLADPDMAVQSLSNALLINRSLQCLNLTKMQLTLKGIRILADAMKQKMALQELQNHIGDEGAGILAEAIQTDPHMLELHLDHNDITTSGAQKLLDALPYNLTMKQLPYCFTIRLAQRKSLPNS